ncbi:MAG: hypothetical protein HQL17_02225 [Candidatus Omnitrophica bacterium]|nr:hypothetical protein [Candidatus Omnitrophota bacterium]
MVDVVIRKIIALFMVVSFLLTGGVVPASAQALMSKPGEMVALSPAFHPSILSGVKIYADDPFRFDFILDKGDTDGVQRQSLTNESSRLIKYFLASITVPEKDLWVNLSPYEKDRIVPEAFGTTEMGRDLLAQDYLLKHITSSLMFPDGDLGKKFWAEVYKQAREKFGTSDIPVDTFNKVWIVPQKAVVYENKNAAYVVESRLKVMLDSDYVAQGAAAPSPLWGGNGRGDLAKELIREIILPAIEKEVNEGKNFAQLRQVYHSLILAIWFKDKIKESVLGKAYIDQDKVAGVDIEDKAAKEKIWAQYVEAFKKGAYNYIKEDVDAVTQQPVSRKYFSGGAGLYATRSIISKTNDPAQLPQGISDRSMIVEANFKLMYDRQLEWRSKTKQELLAAFSKDTYEEQTKDLWGRDSFEWVDKVGYIPKERTGMSLSYLIAHSSRLEDVALQGKLVTLRNEFLGRLKPLLRAKIAPLDPGAFHITTFPMASLLDETVRDKAKKIVMDFTRDMPEKFRRSTPAKVIGIDMFTPSVIKFSLVWDHEFFTDLGLSIENALKQDADVWAAYGQGKEWEKAGKHIFHITLGSIMEPLTPEEIDQLVDAMAIESTPDKHIDFSLSSGQMITSTDSNTLVLWDQVKGVLGPMAVRTRLSRMSNLAVIYLHGMGGDINNKVGQWLEELPLDMTVVRYTSSRIREKPGKVTKDQLINSAPEGAKIWQWLEANKYLIPSQKDDTVLEINKKAGYTIDDVLDAVKVQYPQENGFLEMVKKIDWISYTFGNKETDRKVKTFDDEIQDLKDVVDATIQKFAELGRGPLQIVLVGESLGGTIVPIIAHELEAKGVKGIVSIVGNSGYEPKSPTVILSEEHPITGKIPEQEEMLRRFREFSGETLIIQAAEDHNPDRNPSSAKWQEKPPLVVPGGHDINSSGEDTEKAIKGGLNGFIISLKERLGVLGKDSAPGGIDLTCEKMKLEIQGSRSGVQFKFDTAMIQQLQNASGLTPIIIDIRPMKTTVSRFFELP